MYMALVSLRPKLSLHLPKRPNLHENYGVKGVLYEANFENFESVSLYMYSQPFSDYRSFETIAPNDPGNGLKR